MSDVWLSPVSITCTSNQLDYGCYSVKKSSFHRFLCHSLDFALTMKLKRRRLVHGGVTKNEVFFINSNENKFL